MRLIIILLLLSSIIPNVYAINIDNNQTNNIDEELIKDKIKDIKMPFIKNIEQYNDDIKYYTDTLIGRVLIYNDRIVYLLNNKVIEEKIIADNIIIDAYDRSITKVNYFVADKRITDIPTYDSIDINFNGITLRLNAYGNNIEKVFIIKPNIKPDIVIDVNEDISIDEYGRLIIDGIAFTKPIAYQIIDGKKVDVDISYKIISSNRYGFDIGSYNTDYELIIDPLIDLDASTYLGGSGNDLAFAMTIDSNNNVFIAGGTSSDDFPIVNGYDDSYNGGDGDAFVAKIFGYTLTVSDYTINPGDNISATAITSNDNIDNVRFVWIDPTNKIQRDITISTTIDNSNRVASDTYNPSIPGTWSIEAHFSDGTVVIETLEVSFHVLNESVIGMIGLIGVSIAVFLYWNRRL